VAEPPQAVRDLVAERQTARERRDFARADALREELRAAGWLVSDTPAGSELVEAPPYQPVDPAATAVQRGQQPGRSQGVVADVVHDVSEILAQPDHGRLMADCLDPVDDIVQFGPVQVGPEVLDVVA